MKINSTEVAKKAGVSRSTVSRVINNNPNVIESTRQKVLRVIEELNYTPNTNAQTLAGKKSSVIGLFIFETDYDGKVAGSTLEYYMNFVSSLAEEVFKYRHQLLIDVVYNQESEIRVRSLFQNGNISCGVFIGSEVNNKFIEDFILTDNKVALIDYSTNSKLITDTVSLINTGDLVAARHITEELIAMGSKKILHISGKLTKLTANQRVKGYKNAIKNSNLPLDNKLIYKGDFTNISGYKAVTYCVENGIEFDSIFAANDLMARGAQKAIEDKGLAPVPIWGVDNLQGSLPMGIMSADPCLEESAIKVVKSLLNPDSESKKVQYTPVRLVRNMNDYLNSYRFTHSKCNHDLSSEFTSI